MRIEAVYDGDVGSVKFFDDDQSQYTTTNTALRRWSGSALLRGFSANLAARSGRPQSAQGGFQLELESSRVYLRTESNAMDVFFRSSVARSNAWTMLSGLSLNVISVTLVFALPVTLRDIDTIGPTLTMSSYFS